MRIRTIAFGLLMLPVLWAGPAFATAFYLALDTNSGKCRVMVTEPDGETMKMLGQEPYGSYDEAEAAMQSEPECAA